MRLAAQVIVVEDQLARAVLRTEADDDAVHGCHAARLIAPLEGAVCEVYFHS